MVWINSRTNVPVSIFITPFLLSPGAKPTLQGTSVRGLPLTLITFTTRGKNPIKKPEKHKKVQRI